MNLIHRFLTWATTPNWRQIASAACLVAYRLGTQSAGQYIYEDSELYIVYDPPSLIGGLTHIRVSLKESYQLVFQASQTTMGSIGPQQYNPGEWIEMLLAIASEQESKMKAENKSRFARLD